MTVTEFMGRKYLKPNGGPTGYLYVLASIDSKKNNVLKFIDDGECNSENNNDISTTSKSSMFKKYLSFIKWLIIAPKQVKEIEDCDSEIIHFHGPENLYTSRKALNKYNGIVVLTSHSPEMAAFEEMHNKTTKLERIFMGWFYYILRIRDIRAFNIADYIVFPCPEAEEPYQHSWHGFEKFKKKNINKFKYLLTGTNERTAKVSRNEIRKQLNIPENAFVVSYVGRHNTTKGYDILKNIGENILKDNDNVYFVICGKEEPIKGIDNSRWIEIGWTTDPHSYIAASDLFVLPNRETYFDLVLLEVMSLGTPVLLSRTGGNKHFENENSTGLIFYESQEEAVSKILQLKDKNEVTLKEIGEANKKLFCEKFSQEIFYDNYIQLMNEIYKTHNPLTK